MSKYVGMTVNERLYISGLMDDFDKAIYDKNIKKVVSILKSVELSEESILPILDSFGFEQDDIKAVLL
jgi:hypothetical protein